MSGKFTIPDDWQPTASTRLADRVRVPPVGKFAKVPDEAAAARSRTQADQQEAEDAPPGISEWAFWLIANWSDVPRPLLPAVRRRFGLSTLQAITVIREAKRKRDNPVLIVPKPAQRPEDARPARNPLSRSAHRKHPYFDQISYGVQPPTKRILEDTSGLPSAPVAPQSGKERKAAFVERQRQGLIMLNRVVVDEIHLLDILQTTGNLEWKMADNPAAIAEATGKLLDSLKMTDAYMDEQR